MNALVRADAARLRGFHPDGAPLVGAVDWIPATARIDADSWSIDSDDALVVGFHDLTPHWEGMISQTEGGFVVFTTENGRTIPEDGVVLRAVDAGGKPIGPALPFRPKRAPATVFDDGCAAAMRALVAAADGVAAAWDRGDLAAAVRTLTANANALRPLLPPSAAQPAPTPDTETNR